MVSHQAVHTLRERGLLACAVLLFLVPCSVQAQQASGANLADGLRPFCQALAGQQAFSLQGDVEASIDGNRQKVSLQLVRYSDVAFDLSVTHSDYAFALRRRGDTTALALPRHGVVYLGAGEVDADDHLAPAGVLARLITARTSVSTYMPVLKQADPSALSLILAGLFQVQWDADSGAWRIGDKATLKFPQPGSASLESSELTLQFQVKPPSDDLPAVDDWADLRPITLDRRQLEWQLSRGARRALEILAPSLVLTKPRQTPRQTSHGELRWVEGQRVVLLKGTPEEVGRAHGELLRDEAMACVDSVLNTFGTVQTVRTGRWFRHDLDSAYARLKPFIPERHLVETRALASALGVDAATAEAVNVFPEMFHCSGFALFGKATADGKLYHGRVLDYMTEIGLQDAATTFIVSVDGQIPFANVGYAGFIGSVSGMNAQAVSLGEMGGRGEGNWDGVPMATLMRRALEECETLDEVIQLWKDSPRTCEYYYVFADGKTNQAVGVAAVPESIEFIQPGQSHPRLGEGIEDAVLLSAGSRLDVLRERVQEKYGQFDAQLGQWLMSRPVAMKSNLHNVLFVPADGVLFVANADHRRPAAECRYVRLDLKSLLAEPLGKQTAVAPAVPADTK